MRGAACDPFYGPRLLNHASYDAMEPNPRPACHAEGRGFGSHHPLL